MRKANSRIPALNQVFPNLNPNHALVETPKAKLLDGLREGLRSHPYSLRLQQWEHSGISGPQGYQHNRIVSGFPLCSSPDTIFIVRRVAFTLEEG
jgi:hypothetical protein